MMDFAAAAKLLGEETSDHATVSDVDYMARVSRGFGLKALARLAEKISPDDPQFKYRIVPKASLARFKAARRLSAQQSVVLMRVADVWVKSLRIWQTPEETRNFLSRPHALLENRRPLDLVLENELGANLVHSVLGRLDNGSAV